MLALLHFPGNPHVGPVGSLLRLSSPSRITFVGPFTHRSHAVLKMDNTSDTERVAFKVNEINFFSYSINSSK